MRCDCCGRNLSDYESTLRHAETKVFLDTCLKCLEDLDIPVKGRKDLLKTQDVNDNSDDFDALKEVRF
jgi:hypothetical protein